MLGALLGGVASVGTSLYNAQKDKERDKRSYEYTKSLQDASNKFNAEEAEKAYQRQKELLKMQQDYNTPTAQMQRLLAAGLNPNLIYGNALGGDVSAASTPQATNASASQFQVANNFGSVTDTLSNVANLMQNAALNRAQISKLGAEVGNINENTELTKKQSSNVEASTENLLYTLKDILPTQYHKGLAEIDKLVQDMRNSQTLTTAQVSQLEAATSQLLSDVELKGKQRDHLEKVINKYDDYINSQTNLNNQQQQMLSQQYQIRQRFVDIMDDIIKKMDRNNQSEGVQGLQNYFLLYIMSQFMPK